MNRKKYEKIWGELDSEKNMIFLSGPRQAGKTTFAQKLLEKFSNKEYFNWDILDDKNRLMQNNYFFENVDRIDNSTPIIVLDEIHKYKDWKNYLKGVYDKYSKEFKFLITGSGRLDVYKKGGDSLAGRYRQFHLFPFTLSELSSVDSNNNFHEDVLLLSMDHVEENKEIFRRIMEFSGFPEPYLNNKQSAYRRWSRTYIHQLIREDIRDLTNIKVTDDVELLFQLLPSKVGSSLSLQSLANDLKVAYNTVSSWMSVLEKFYLVFQLPAWTNKLSRSIKKEKKCYLWDIPRIQNSGAKFENFVALELYKAITIKNDMGEGDFSLHFVKNKDGQEVDFLIAENNKPLVLIEAKVSDESPSKSLLKFQKALSVPAIQLVAEMKSFRKIRNDQYPLLIAPAYQWLAGL